MSLAFKVSAARSILHGFVGALRSALGAFGETPMIQEIAERRSPEAFPVTAEVRRFFQLFTLAWALYFSAKAAFYAYVAWRLPLVEALALRSLVGGVSLGLMIAVSVIQGSRLFFLCRAFGLLPHAAPREEFLQA
jgi:hypothetical protein